MSFQHFLEGKVYSEKTQIILFSNPLLHGERHFFVSQLESSKTFFEYLIHER